MSKKSVRNLVIAIILIISSAVGFIFMITRVIAQGAELNEQLTSLAEERAQEVNYLHLQRLAEESAGDRTQLQSYFFDKDDDSITLLNNIEALAEQSDITLETKDLKSVTDPVDKSVWAEMTFSYAGKKDQVRDFLRVLETLPYVLRITQVEMTALSSVDWTTDVTLRVLVLNYDE